MPQLLLILLGTLMLLFALLGASARKRRAAGNVHSPYLLPLERIPFPQKAPRLLRTVVRTHDTSGALQGDALRLMEALMRIRAQVRRAPRLPADVSGFPRMVELAEQLVTEGSCTADDMLRALDALPLPAVPSETAYLPVCMAAVQCARIESLLQALRPDPRARRQDAPAEESVREQTELLAELRQAVSCLRMLHHLPWERISESHDSLHALLLEDPSGVYARMDAPSRLSLRLIVERISRHARMDAQDVLRAALKQCQEAEAGSLEASIAYWFLDAEGTRGLHRALHTRRGWLYAWLIHRRYALRYAALWAMGAGAGFAFLQSGNPVFMLPAFAIAAGCIFRALLPARAEALPRLTADPIPDEMRTLIVLPAVLHDEHEAIRLVRRMKTLRRAFPAKNADLLLVGDPAPHSSPVSAADNAVVSAAAMAVAALNDGYGGRVMYLQRGRIWDRARHTCCARNGFHGALECVCRMIAQGGCADPIAFASFDPASLHRHYAFVLSLDATARPAPGMLEKLLAAMSHPLCTPVPTPEGRRGHAVLAPEGSADVRLIRPDAFLEALGGLAPDEDVSRLLTDALTDCATVRDADATTREPVTLAGLLEAAHRQAVEAWACARWQLPYVQAPAGFVRNPLRFMARFRLREALRSALIPAAQILLLLFALLTGSPLLVVIALLGPELSALRRISRRELLRLISRTALLPTRAVTALLGAWAGLIGKEGTHRAALLRSEVWAQGISAAVMTALALTMPYLTLPCLLLAVLFGCFPLAHRVHDLPERTVPAPTVAQRAMLAETAAATWQFFCHSVSEDTRHLPPERVQTAPDLGPSRDTSPEAIGGYLLSIVCAKDAGWITAGEAAARMAAALESMNQLSLPYGLPCRRYALPSLTVLDARTDTAAVGFLLCACMTCAQALRSWLPELPPQYGTCSAGFETFAMGMRISALYDRDAGLLRAGLDENGQPQGHVECFADEALLLSVAGCARRLIPLDHLARLSRTRVRLHRQVVLISPTGTAAQQLLAGLFVPLEASMARRFIRLMKQEELEGMFGQSRSAWQEISPSMQLSEAEFGLRDCALTPARADRVYAPYAAALCLPFLPADAVHSLEQMARHGASGPHGFCDALDCRAGVQPVRVMTAFHQAIVLMAAAHVLADSPVQRYFCALPEVEACLSLLETKIASPVLPALHCAAVPAARHPGFAIPADPLMLPRDAHLLGSSDFHLCIDAACASKVSANGLQLTQSPSQPGAPSGLQCYISDEGRVYRMGDPALAVQAVYPPGEAQFTQLCGSMKAALRVTVDAAHQQALYVLTITNLSDRDRVIETADCLLPDLGAPADTLAVLRENEGHLAAHARASGQMLHHRFQSSAPLLACAVCTDAEAFMGRGRTLHHPASLEEPMADLFMPSVAPCLSFRARLSLAGHGQAVLVFSVSTRDHAIPPLADLNGVTRLCAMQQLSMAAIVPVTEVQICCAMRLAGMLLHRASPDMPAIHFNLGGEEGLPVLTDLLSACQWLSLHGLRLRIHVLCPEALRPAVNQAAAAHMAEELLVFTEDETPLTTLALTGEHPLIEQLDAHRFRLPSVVDTLPPGSAAHADAPHIVGANGFGGFDPDNGDYIIRLAPHMTTPAPWSTAHASRVWRETADESGLCEPYHEQVWLRLDDGTVLSPWSEALERTVRMGRGETTWECAADRLEITLHAACMPGRTAGLRVLQLRSTADTPLHLRLLVSATLPNAPIDCQDGCAMARSSRASRPFIGGEGWHARVTAPELLTGLNGLPSFHAPDVPGGCLALLERELTIAPHMHEEVVWLSGQTVSVRHALSGTDWLRMHGASAMLRSIRELWARMDALYVNTPDESLNRLLERLLPVQCFTALGLAGLPAIVCFAPTEAKQRFLQCARRASTRLEWVDLAFHLTRICRVTGDRSLADVWLPERESSLWTACSEAVLSLPLDAQGLPMTDEPSRDCFLHALAAGMLSVLHPSADLDEFRLRLLNTADSRLWADAYYGQDGLLRLDVQALAAAAYDPDARTRQAIRTAWDTLWQPEVGLLRQAMSRDLPVLPGLPENGGMQALPAVGFLAALIRQGMLSEAYALLHALNPIHHTATPLQAERFRCAPYRLHGGMCDSPMEAGRATTSGGDAAAGWLYAILLEKLLGYVREGNTVRLAPRVPREWAEFSLTQRFGTSTWHISLERRIKALTIDGEAVGGDSFTLTDDGRVHQVRFPLT